MHGSKIQSDKSKVKELNLKIVEYQIVVGQKGKGKREKVQQSSSPPLTAASHSLTKSPMGSVASSKHSGSHKKSKVSSSQSLVQAVLMEGISK